MMDPMGEPLGIEIGLRVSPNSLGQSNTQIILRTWNKWVLHVTFLSCAKDNLQQLLKNKFVWSGHYWSVCKGNHFPILSIIFIFPCVLIKPIQTSATIYPHYCLWTCSQPSATFYPHHCLLTCSQPSATFYPHYCL
jgi:hypothetical protein